MKHTILACCLNGILLGVIKLFYELVPEPMSNLLYCTFLGFTVTLAVGAQIRELGDYLGSILMGIIWVMGYVGIESMVLQLLIPFSISPPISRSIPQSILRSGAKGVAFGFMSFVIEASNLLFIGKTRFRFVPLQFAVVIGVFSQQCRHIPYVLAAILIGVLTALLSKKIYLEFLPTLKE